MTRSFTPSRRLISVIGAALCLGAGTASSQMKRTVVDFPLRLIDLSFISDTVSGVQVLMQPSVQSKQAKEGGLIWLQFDPDTVLDWINGAAAALAVPVPNGPVEGIQWSRTLVPLGRHGGVSLGRQRKKATLDKTRWLAIGDSATGWKAELNATEADSLLKLLLTVGMQSRLDTAAVGPYKAYQVDSPVQVLQQPVPRYRGKVGRVIAFYVVDEKGDADPGTFDAVLASDPALIDAAWQVLRATRFKPAQRAGKPVPQLVLQTIVWYPNPSNESP